MPGLLRGIARTAIVAGTATAVSNRVSRRQDGRWARQEEQPPYPPQAQGEAMDDEATMRLSQLRDLGELKSQGVLTQEEFEQQKQWILNQ